jgi:hypothetical protein
MSADNWDICPNCLSILLSTREKMKNTAESAYGKVPQERYLQLIQKASEPVSLESTLQEDYKIYTNDQAEFSITYSCSCSKCGFEHSFKHKEILEM